MRQTGVHTCTPARIAKESLTPLHPTMEQHKVLSGKLVCRGSGWNPWKFEPSCELFITRIIRNEAQEAPGHFAYELARSRPNTQTQIPPIGSSHPLLMINGGEIEHGGEIRPP